MKPNLQKIKYCRVNALALMADSTVNQDSPRSASTQSLQSLCHNQNVKKQYSVSPAKYSNKTGSLDKLNFWISSSFQVVCSSFCTLKTKKHCYTRLCKVIPSDRKESKSFIRYQFLKWLSLSLCVSMYLSFCRSCLCKHHILCGLLCSIYNHEGSSCS